jgi:hypothetical protein
MAVEAPSMVVYKDSPGQSIQSLMQTAQNAIMKAKNGHPGQLILVVLPEKDVQLYKEVTLPP